MVGKNIVNVVYKNKYLGDDLGLSSFVDTDSRQYVYSVFEPYLANRAFFLFDQPDLKARMELFVLCPDEWRIESNNDEKTKLFVFPATEILPTYLYAVIAGPYSRLSIENSYKVSFHKFRTFQCDFSASIHIFPSFKSGKNKSLK